MVDGKSSEDDSASPDLERSIGAESLKAFAHPLRMRLYAQLQRSGSATASQLARELDESSGQTSYHLRQLERHGFVEDDPDRTGGRERWWRPVGFRLTDPELMDDPASTKAVGSVIGQVIAERTATLTSWLEHLDPRLATGTGQLSSSSLTLNAGEADQLAKDLLAVVEKHAQAAKSRTTPDDARRFRVYVDVIPLSFDEPGRQSEGHAPATVD